jgi:RHS repeat-associated protein
MLKQVICPDRKKVQFEYDALGRRTAKLFDNTITRWVWDGNTPLHEWKYDLPDRPQPVIDEWGQVSKDKAEPTENLVTWIFDEGSFRPAAKIEGKQQYSIITDYLGTPKEVYDTWGNKIWEIELEAYGKVRSCSGDESFIPFRFQGQYHDEETGLYYNRFRYYSPEEGMYVTAQDPIRLKGGDRLYEYVHDPNVWMDPLGLVNAPASLPNTSGIYIATNERLNKAYVGLGGSGFVQGMNDRLSASSDPGQELLKHKDTVVKYREVDVSSLNTQGERNRVLRVFEKAEYEKKVKAGYDMLNAETVFLTPKKLEEAKQVIKDKGIKAKRTKICN